MMLLSMVAFTVSCEKDDETTTTNDGIALNETSIKQNVIGSWKIYKSEWDGILITNPEGIICYKFKENGELYLSDNSFTESEMIKTSYEVTGTTIKMRMDDAQLEVLSMSSSEFKAKLTYADEEEDGVQIYYFKRV